MMKKYELRLSNGVTVLIEFDEEIIGRNLGSSLSHGMWFTDEHGWTINPAHVVFYREDADD